MRNATTNITMNVTEFKDHLTKDIIPFWNNLKDEEYGGFYGYADGTGKASPKKEKGVILNSRILWFYSSAYMLLKDPELLSMAAHAFHFFTEHCIDRPYGGIYWSLNYDGTPADTTKHTYNQAFAIYALSTYYQASGDSMALTLAYDLYRLIETTCSDEGGYLEAFNRDFTPAENDKLSENGVMASRTMNTLLHVLEAYTVLYRADGFHQVKESLETILKRFQEKIYNPERKIFEVFFDNNYTPLIDLESYGHDIEASWLLDKACVALGDPKYLQENLFMISGLAEGALEHGMDTVLHAMNNEAENGIANTTKIWWVQAETVTGFYNAYQRHPEKTQYLEASQEVWNFIKEYVIDKNTGEWIENIDDVNAIDDTQALAHPWKCPYHNGRMCIEMIQRLQESQES